MSLLFITLLMLTILEHVVMHNNENEVCINQRIITSPTKRSLCNQKEEETAAFRNNFSNQFLGRNDRRALQPNNFIQNSKSCVPAVKSCNSRYKYRSIDGSCNNLLHKRWGKAGTEFSRMLPAYYTRQEFPPQLTNDGRKRPLSRILSTSLFESLQRSDNVTLVVTEWGQLVTHDITYSVQAANPADPTVDCCSDAGKSDNKRCLPILIPKNDTFYSPLNVTCFTATRSSFSCQKHSLDQVNGVTHYLDASIVYGSDLKTSNSLREFQGGRLKIRSIKNRKGFLPNSLDNVTNNACYTVGYKDKVPCPFAGDFRVYQHPEITVIQTLLLREHNRIVKKLEELHADWDDEMLYQEGRAIVVAEFQHITYSEWLELYIGKKNMIRSSLYPNDMGFTVYNRSVNPMTINSFTAAAFRFGHSGIPSFYSMMDYNLKLVSNEILTDRINCPGVIEDKENFDEIILGIINQPMPVLGPFSPEMKTLMFHYNKPYGKDLLSIDIEKGRDHGLAPYIHYLDVCTGLEIKSFEDLKRYIHEKDIELLKKHYEKVEDIDLFVGGAMETKVEGSRLGTTFLCIITEQFYRKKWGDRFWYEVGYEKNSFTAEQVHEIKKTSLSRLICDNSDNITQISINSFLPPSESNKIVDCSSIGSVDLTKWT